jgi:Fe-S-cluster containining protein
MSDRQLPSCRYCRGRPCNTTNAIPHAIPDDLGRGTAGNHIDNPQRTVRETMPGQKSATMKPPLSETLSPAAEAMHQQILGILHGLVDSNYPSCLDSGFVREFGEVVRLFDALQSLRLSDEGKHAVCAMGCTACCNHWVEDVYSYEAEMAIAYIRRSAPDRIPSIVSRSQDDMREMEALDRVLSKRLHEQPRLRAEAKKRHWEPVDLLLASFYQLRRPCPLLEESGACLIYPVRPMTCRSYLSLKDPRHCDADYINEEEITTVIVDLAEDANSLLDRMHFVYDRFGGDTSLRSLMGTYLTVDSDADPSATGKQRT